MTVALEITLCSSRFVFRLRDVFIGFGLTLCVVASTMRRISESDVYHVYRRQILTYKINPRTEKVHYL